MARERRKKTDPATEAFERGVRIVEAHPIFAPLSSRLRVDRSEPTTCPPQGWVVAEAGRWPQIRAHPKRHATPEEWAYVVAHAYLHYGLGHFRDVANPVAWQVACDVVIARFLKGLKLGRAPDEMVVALDGLPSDEESLYRRFCRDGIPPPLFQAGTAGERCPDMTGHAGPEARKEWQRLFAAGLAHAVTAAVEVAAGHIASLASHAPTISVAEQARQWFMSTYPLLGSLAAAFRIVEDPLVCHREQISIAAVDASSREIYINPAAALSTEELRFVMAHELLHVGLRHQARREGRDPFLWNVACDYVVNGWLLEMGVGVLPAFGGLYDPSLKGLSAEAIYDQLATDLRRARKLATLRGTGLGDMLGESEPWWERGPGISLDEFYRRSLAQGLSHHEAQGRGFLPAGLVEEIRALAQPPIPWDVELAKWFDERFAPVEKRRSFARPSRRQASTPDIPRPAWLPDGGALEGRTFGVVLDTSGSMPRQLLAKALGAIASYAMARDVPRARVVFCDAVAYDEGYMPPEAILGRVQVRGRGGTRLQPGIDLLQEAEDFPTDGPLLVITDGACDRLQIKRDHAFLLPPGAHLPFVPRGKVFRIS